MAIRRRKSTNPKPKGSQKKPRALRSPTRDFIIVEAESLNPKSPSKHQQDPPPGEALLNDQPTVEDSSKDRQPAEDSITDLVLEDPPALRIASHNQPIVEGLTVVPLTAEAPSEVPPEMESSTDPPELRGAPEDQPTADVQSEDQRTAEGRTNLEAGEAPEDLPAVECLPNGQSPTASPVRELLDGEFPKEPIESSSDDQSTEDPSEDDIAGDLPIIKPSTDGQKLNREKERARVLNQASKRKVIYIDSGDESDIASPLPAHRPHKRPKHTPKDVVNPPAPNSPSNGRRNGRRNTNRRRVKPREWNDYVDIEKGWLDSSLSKCRKFLQFCENLNQDMLLLEDLDAKAYQIFNQVPARFVSRATLLDSGAQLKNMEKQRRRLTSVLRRSVSNFTAEAASMDQDLERWYAEENEFTRRIERSC